MEISLNAIRPTQKVVSKYQLLKNHIGELNEVLLIEKPVSMILDNRPNERDSTKDLVSHKNQIQKTELVESLSLIDHEVHARKKKYKKIQRRQACCLYAPKIICIMTVLVTGSSAVTAIKNASIGGIVNIVLNLGLSICAYKEAAATKRRYQKFLAKHTKKEELIVANLAQPKPKKTKKTLDILNQTNLNLDQLNDAIVKIKKEIKINTRKSWLCHIGCWLLPTTALATITSEIWALITSSGDVDLASIIADIASLGLSGIWSTLTIVLADQWLLHKKSAYDKEIKKLTIKKNELLTSVLNLTNDVIITKHDVSRDITFS